MHCSVSSPAPQCAFYLNSPRVRNPRLIGTHKPVIYFISNRAIAGHPGGFI